MDDSPIILESDDDDVIILEEKKPPARNRFNVNTDDSANEKEDSDDVIFVPSRLVDRDLFKRSDENRDAAASASYNDSMTPRSPSPVGAAQGPSGVSPVHRISPAEPVIARRKRAKRGGLRVVLSSICDNSTTRASPGAADLGPVKSDPSLDDDGDADGEEEDDDDSSAGLSSVSFVSNSADSDNSPVPPATTPRSPGGGYNIYRAPPLQRRTPEIPVEPASDAVLPRDPRLLKATDDSDADVIRSPLLLKQLVYGHNKSAVLISNHPECVASTSVDGAGYADAMRGVSFSHEPAVRYISSDETDAAVAAILPGGGAADRAATDSDDSVVFLEHRTKFRGQSFKTEPGVTPPCPTLALGDAKDSPPPGDDSSPDNTPRSSKDGAAASKLSLYDSLSLDLKPFESIFAAASTAIPLPPPDPRHSTAAGDPSVSSTSACVSTTVSDFSALSDMLDFDLPSAMKAAVTDAPRRRKTTNLSKLKRSLSVPHTKTKSGKVKSAAAGTLPPPIVIAPISGSDTTSASNQDSLSSVRSRLSALHRSLSHSGECKHKDSPSAFMPYKCQKKRKLPPANIRAILYHWNNPETPASSVGGAVTRPAASSATTSASAGGPLDLSSALKASVDVSNIPFKKRYFSGGSAPSTSAAAGVPSSAAGGGTGTDTPTTSSAATRTTRSQAWNTLFGLKSGSSDPFLGAVVPTFGGDTSTSFSSSSYVQVVPRIIGATSGSAISAPVSFNVSSGACVAVSAHPVPSVVTMSTAVPVPAPAEASTSSAGSAVSRAHAAADERNYACKKCMNLTISQEITRCTSWHGCCNLCIQKEVKNLLARNQKGALKCVFEGCDSLYSTAELKRALPPLLVEILEEKLEIDIADQVMAELPDFPGMSTTPEFGRVDQVIEAKQGGPALVKLPGYWEPMDPEDTGYKLVELDPSMSEYAMVTEMFKQTMPPTKFQITKVTRVQNPDLYQFYCVKKSQMKKDGDNNRVSEQLLFHGTQKDVVDAICKNNIDWRYSGKNATAFGKGSYFARDSNYSHNYTDNARVTVMTSMRGSHQHHSFVHNFVRGTTSQGLNINLHNPGVQVVLGHLQNSVLPPTLSSSLFGAIPTISTMPGPAHQGPPMLAHQAPAAAAPHPGGADSAPSHVMFLAHVLVGRYSFGTPHLRRPPPLDPSDQYGKAYDSCVNCTKDPTIYVIFDSAQIYPEYLVEYSPVPVVDR